MMHREIVDRCGALPGERWGGGTTVVVFLLVVLVVLAWRLGYRPDELISLLAALVGLGSVIRSHTAPVLL